MLLFCPNKKVEEIYYRTECAGGAARFPSGSKNFNWSGMKGEPAREDQLKFSMRGGFYSQAHENAFG
ncbi:MAG: hypothetical protein PSX81_07180 [bacterium]|nr:hypothetical protein [bacterium]